MICFVDCSLPEIEFAVNGGRSVDSGVSLTVGDVLTCSAEDAVLYRWTNVHNGSGTKTYGKTLHISQPGSFIYKCTVFTDCETDSFCPFARNISGFAAGISIALHFYASETIVSFIGQRLMSTNREQISCVLCITSQWQ